MGLISNRLDRESLKPGDHIYSWRAAYLYAHHGIYLGDDKVVHFTRRGQELQITGTSLDAYMVCSFPTESLMTCPTCIYTNKCNGVITSCLNCFLGRGLLHRFEYSISPAAFLTHVRGGTCTLAASDPPEKVLHRVDYLLKNGFGCYNIIKNNCIDFAVYCKTGLIVDKKTTIGPTEHAASILGGPFASMFSATRKLLKTNIYVQTASNFVGFCSSRYATDILLRNDVIKVPLEELSWRHNNKTT